MNKYQQCLADIRDLEVIEKRTVELLTHIRESLERLRERAEGLAEPSTRGGDDKKPPGPGDPGQP